MAEPWVHLSETRKEEFEKLLQERGGKITRREEAKLWREADLRAREREKLPGYSQGKWGERYYDHLGPMPGWRIKERPNITIGVIAVLIIILLWLTTSRHNGF